MTDDTDLSQQMIDMGRRARAASRALELAGATARTRAINGMADALARRADHVLAANAEDLKAAKAAGMAPAMMDRLALDRARVPISVISVARSVSSVMAPASRLPPQMQAGTAQRRVRSSA